MRIYTILLWVILLAHASLVQSNTSTCFGETHAGSITGAVQLAKTESNYAVFSDLAWFLGRTYVHSEVNHAITDSYAALAKQLPHHLFVYGETGWKNGGIFKPHRTHQNGLSVDFMVPVKSNNQPSQIPMNFSNKWGYDLEFDDSGQYFDLEIDFSAMALHLRLLHESAVARGHSIHRVYFDPQLQPLLFASPDGEFIKRHIKFNAQQAWVRHDEHYHVDFKITCEKRK